MNIKLKELQQGFLHTVQPGQVFRIGHDVYMMICFPPSIIDVGINSQMIVVDLTTGELQRMNQDRLVDFVDGHFVEGA